MLLNRMHARINILNNNGESALLAAVSHGNLKVVELFQAFSSQRDDQNLKCDWLICNQTQNNCLHLLTQSLGSQGTTDPPETVGVKARDTELTSNYLGMYDIIKTAILTESDDETLFPDFCARWNSENTTPFHITCSFGNTDMVPQGRNLMF